jgi:hypothetical protein
MKVSRLKVSRHLIVVTVCSVLLLSFTFALYFLLCCLFSWIVESRGSLIHSHAVLSWC